MGGGWLITGNFRPWYLLTRLYLALPYLCPTHGYSASPRLVLEKTKPRLREQPGLQRSRWNEHLNFFSGMRNKRVQKLLRAVAEAVLLGLVSGVAKASGLMLFTYLLQR